MYIDKLLEFGSNTLTSTANAPNDVDQLAKGSAMDGIERPWLVVRMGTLLDSAGEGATLKIALMHDSASGFGTVVEAMSITLTEAADLTAANKILWIAMLPPRLKRYLRVTYTVSGENFTSGTIEAFVAANVDVLVNSY